MKAGEFTKCICCGKGIAHAGDLTFLRIEVEYLMLNPRAIQRQHGLEMMIGNAAIAAIMGPGEDFTGSIGKGVGLICGRCMLNPSAFSVPFNLFEMTTAGEADTPPDSPRNTADSNKAIEHHRV